MTQFKIGHSGITWGYDVSTVEAAIKDLAELGYSGFETFGRVIEEYDQTHSERFEGLLARYGMPLSAVYCSARFHDPTHAVAPGGGPRQDVVRWARRTSELGATTLVLAAGSSDGRPYTHPIQWEGMAAVFNGIAREVAAYGVITAIHPHTGTLIETRSEIDAIMRAVDPTLVGFAPDTGQIAKGGSDMLAVLRAYKERIWHVHLKDYAGGRETGYVGYEAIGQGVLDIPAIFQILEGARFDKWISVELDGTPQSPRAPREAAAMSKRYLEPLLGERTGWRR
ncbi:MAG: sugar phosphate isomerase/epimerase [Chloroflexi bacterium]|nr:sugar phosphate isomerase/epimerase [Chloroflexota bacterium]